ncbi:U32 family peptidase [Sulfuriroseicoccus oceanibius]|uniref:U32 family peptidase n=1 Tax=Sulfuriroseicoccus oceanibius TaxID=2707525 RepID=A0A6B3LEG4_9BACT|nr:U32 family peptidase [Sulfuriroseicoccus oceanibius]QQL45800.1 U32 family peptidase [Sulfuriroseicoccus oceanibius]
MIHRSDLELLAPAGSWECARAAIANGADAIFFGLPKHNARLRADNFTEEDLPELMKFLHEHGAKGFITMNTLIFPAELEGAAEQLALLEASGVDGAIIQDLGLADLARKVAPSVELHASTQMSITSPEGLDFATGLLNLDRAVLARELSLDEIRRFTKVQGHTPLEIFVHGALCVAYSGQCLTSESLGQRSANRGECAQACRLPYEMVVDGKPLDLGERRYLLSPQDLAAVDLIPELIDAGVISFKIEGRLKSPEYVAAVTRVYRKAIDAHLDARTPRPDATDRYSLEMTFSRGLSTGWLEGTNHPRLTHGKFGKKRGVLIGSVAATGPGWVRIQRAPGQQEIPLQSGDGVVFDAGEDRNEEQGGRIWKTEGDRILFGKKHNKIVWKRVKPGQLIWKTSDPSLEQDIRKTWNDKVLDQQRTRTPLDWTVSGTAGAPLKLTDSATGLSVESDQPLEAARNRPLDHDVLHAQFERLGNTPFTLRKLDTKLEGELALPVSALNRMRRTMVTKLEEHTPEDAPQKAAATPLDAIAALSPEVHPPVTDQPSELSVLCRHPWQIDAALEAGVERIYVDYEDIRRMKDAVAQVRSANTGARIWLATPRIQKSGEQGYFKTLHRAEPDGILVRNLGGIEYFTKQSDTADLDTVGDFSLNVANQLTAKLLIESAGLDRVTVSYDLNADQSSQLIASAPPEWFEMTLHQHMPMFHMEHCAFCTFLSEGTSYKDCGRPCEKHVVQLRDRVGQLHTLQADVGCRNTLFNGRAQTGARYFNQFHRLGLRNYRIELLTESQVEAADTIAAYQALLERSANGESLWQDLGATEQLGVTEGTLTVLH